MAWPATRMAWANARSVLCAVAPLLEVVEEVDLVVLGGAEDGGGDEDRRDVERDAEPAA